MQLNQELGQLPQMRKEMVNVILGIRNQNVLDWFATFCQ